MKESDKENDRSSVVFERGGRAQWIRRLGSRQRNFKYVDSDNKTINSVKELERIKLLAIPPAWTKVRICPNPQGKLQAIGTDTAGRVQYRYSAKFSLKQQEKKFARLEKFGRVLPALRNKLNTDITLAGYPKEKVLAVMIRLINDLYIRIGSEKSVKLYKTYGVTTLRNRHLQIKANELHLDFVGKHHIRHRKILVDEELATVIKELKEVGGSKLFNYEDASGHICQINPRDINDYIKTTTEGEFSAKDFRTWGASVLAAQELAEIGIMTDKKQINKSIVRVVKIVAERLGNTPAVCRSSYIHPAIINCYEKNLTIEKFVPRAKHQIRKIEPEYSLEEFGLLKLLTNQKCR